MIFSDCQNTGYKGYSGGRWRGCCFRASPTRTPRSRCWPGSRTQEDVMRDIVWKRMVDIKKWQFYPEQYTWDEKMILKKKIHHHFCQAF